MRRHLTEPDVGWAWMVMLGSFGAHMISGCFLYAVGVIHNAILERFNEDVGKTAWASGLYLGMVSLTGVLASALINRYSCRVTMFIGAFLMAVGFGTSALLPSLNWVILFFGGVGGIGGGLTYTASVVVLGFNFHKKRNLAGGIAVSGCGVGTFVLAPAIEAARETYGNTGLFFIIAGIGLHQGLFGCLFFPSKLESERKELRKQKFKNTKSKKKLAILNNILHSFHMLKHFSLLIFCVSMCFCCIGIYLVYVHFPRYAIVNGSTPMQASFLMSVSGLCNCVSRMLAGMAANSENVDETIMYFGTFGLLGLSTILFPLYSSTYGGQAAYAVFLGLYSGCCYAIINTLIIQLVGIDELATGFGIAMFFAGIGSLIGPPLAGTIVDVGGSYEGSFLLAGFGIIIAAFLGLMTSCFEKSGQALNPPHKPDQDIVIETNEKHVLSTETNITEKHDILDNSCIVLDGHENRREENQTAYISNDVGQDVQQNIHLLDEHNV